MRRGRFVDSGYGDYDEDGNGIEEQLAPVVRLLKSDWIIALCLAAATVAAMMLFAFPGLNPDSWSAASTAAGIRPPSSIFPGLWILAGKLPFFAGGELSLKLFRLLGVAFAGMTAFGSYLLFRAVNLMVVRKRLRSTPLRQFVQQLAVSVGTVGFMFSDPVWRMGQAFSPDGFLSLLTIVGIALFCFFMLNGSKFCAYGSMALFGLLSSDSPLGLLVFVVCWMAYFVALNHHAVAENLPTLDAVNGSIVKWKMTFFYVTGLVAGIALNCLIFTMTGGVDALGCSASDIPLMYLVRYWQLAAGSGSFLGIVLGVGVCVFPCIVTLKILPSAVDEERLLPYHVGVVYFVTALLTFTQLAMVSPLWFWNWSDAAVINSHYLLSMLMMLSAITVVSGLNVFGVDACCRNHRWIATQYFSDGDGDPDDAVPAKSKRGLVVFLILAAFGIVAVVPGRRMVDARRLLAIIEDYANEVVAECGDAKWIFTDGAFDTYLELKAAAAGKCLRTLSMMADNSAYNQSIRLRGVTDTEDRLVLAMGAPMTLRTWMRDKPDRVKECATQLGFELWKRDGKELPPFSGVLSRPAGMSEEARLAGVAASQRLTERVIAIYTAGGIDRSVGQRIRDLFLTVQWRLARTARLRAERADRAGKTEVAMKDVKISDELDKRNESLKTILKDVEKIRTDVLKQITPREGLQLALIRADFVLARRYAEPILATAPADPSANFAMAMSYLLQQQYARAKEHLRRAIVSKPKEPAFWNNLAMVNLKLGELDEAEKNARKALEIIPESAEVKDTIKQILEAKKQKAEKKPEEKKN